MAADSSHLEDEYGKLPDPIKQVVSRSEYLWLGDAEKARLEQELTEPEWQ